MTDQSTQRAIDTMAREIARMQSELDAVKRAQRRPQLGNSSTTGALEFNDPETGETRLRIGRTGDGFGLITEGGDPPTAPTAPVVAPAPLGLMVQWDGQLANEVALSAEFDHVAVFVADSDDYGLSEFAGTIARSGGVLPIVPLELETTYYVWLVGVTTGGVQGDPSESESGVPEPVGGVPAPGSITETEIADDAISTPKLQAEAVNAAKIAANAINAGHITAGAVDASKLAASLVLASTIIAGTPGADRVELDASGMRVYDDAGALIGAFEGGSIALTGSITGSTITGSVIEIGEDVTGSNYGVIEETATGEVRVRVESVSGARAQLAAVDGQAELSAWGSEASDSPIAGFAALPEGAELGVYSDVGAGVGAPHSLLIARTGEATGQWRAPTGAYVEIRADDSSAALYSEPGDSETEPHAYAGALYAFRGGSGVPAMSLQSPITETGPGAWKRALLHLTGGTSTRDYGRAEVHARRIILASDWDASTGQNSGEQGVLFLSNTHSIQADRHAPVVTEMASQPTADGNGDWIDFTESEFPSVQFTTPWAGRVRITVTMAGYNYGSTNASLATGFRLSGPATIGPDFKRAAFVRSLGSDVSSRGAAARSASNIAHMQLGGNVTYTLTPMWRTSTSYPWSRTDSFGDLSQAYDVNCNNSIVIEPLM